MTEVSGEFTKPKIGRRTAKAALTRSGKAVEYEVYHKRPLDEVRSSLLKLNIAFDSLVLKDDELTSLSTDDNEFEKEEKWLTECEEYLLGIYLEAKAYIACIDVEISKTDLQRPEEMIGMQSENPLGNVDSLTQNMYGC